MEYDIPDFLSDVEPKILQRGENYYADGNVARVVRDGNRYSAIVMGGGNEPYHVEIVLSDQRQVDQYACDCPYDYGDVCKHIVAVLRAIQDGKYDAKKEKASVKAEGDQGFSLAAVLRGVPREALEAFIIQIAEDDAAVLSEAVSAFDAPVEMEIKALKAQLSASIRAHSDRGYIDFRNCDSICYDMDQILNKARKRRQKQQPFAALTIAEYIYFSGIKLASQADSSSGLLSFTTDAALSIIEACVEALSGASDTERQAAFALLLQDAQKKAFDGWEDSRYSLLENAACLADPKGAKKLTAYLDKLYASYSKEPYASCYINADKVVRYHLASTLEGKSAARAYINANLDVDELRRIAVMEDMETGNFNNAERLCMEKISQQNHGNFLHPDDWNYVLYDVYVRAGQTEKQIDQARCLLLLGDNDYFDVLQDLMEHAGTWDTAYPLLLAQIKEECSPQQYMSILAKQRELPLLMEQVRLYPDTVFSYGTLLSKKYSVEIFNLCSDAIIHQAQQAKGRRDYQQTCRHLRELIGFGGKDAAALLIRKLRSDYLRRPAFLDELNQVEKFV